MKKRNNIIVSFIICAMLLVGIGFAALTDTLTVTGTVSTAEANVSMVFTKSESSDTNATLGTTGSNTITVGSNAFKVSGDKVTFTLEVTNKSDKDLAVKITTASTVTNNNEEYFTVTYEGMAQNDVVAANGGTDEIVVTVTLNKTPIETQTATFSFTVSGTAQEATA